MLESLSSYARVLRADRRSDVSHFSYSAIRPESDPAITEQNDQAKTRWPSGQREQIGKACGDRLFGKLSDDCFPGFLLVAGIRFSEMLSN